MKSPRCYVNTPYGAHVFQMNLLGAPYQYGAPSAYAGSHAHKSFGVEIGSCAGIRSEALVTRMGAGPSLREWYKVALYFPYITYLALLPYPVFLRKLPDCNMAANLVYQN